MLELDITDLLLSDAYENCSGSVAELGPNASKLTWDAAMQYATENPLISDADIDVAREWLGSFGAWSRDELAAKSNVEINALITQFVSGDLKQLVELAPSASADMGYIDWNEAATLAEEGQVSGRAYNFADCFYYTLGD